MYECNVGVCKRSLVGAEMCIRVCKFSDSFTNKGVAIKVIIICFFFQAEDGIRDLVRSRGLGDVYKRQDYRGI